MKYKCPACEVALERVDYDTNSRGDLLRIPKENSGILGTLGASTARNIHAYLCPECDRVLFYAPE